VAHSTIQKQEVLKEKFHLCLNEVIPSENDLSVSAKKNVCLEIIRKFCNIRI
uniref:Uncharacterized protein n=1 Tax=Amphimedon queenslandica TaxID=400682 RepID=A0A1X7TXB8_AMPQE